MILFTKLILAHLVGDFLLQPDSWVKAKENRKFRSYVLYAHILVHGALIMLLVWDKSFIKWAALLAATHLLIDAIKLMFQTPATRRTFFFLDQLLHLVSIFLIYCWYTDWAVTDRLLGSESFWLLLILIVFNTLPASIVVSVMITKWADDTAEAGKKSLNDAGKYIGILERLFVLAFVIGSHWEAIGFLIAAKSIFRFGDLRKSQDRKLTEYVLIGTMASFGLAVASGLLYNALIQA